MNHLAKKPSSPWFLLCVVALVAVAAGVIVWQLNSRKQEVEPTPIQLEPEPTAAEPVQSDLAPELAETEASGTEAAPDDPTPLTPSEPVSTVSLDASDVDVIGYLAQGPAAALTKWLTPEHIIRKLVRAINALEEGKLVAQYRPIQSPETPFKAVRDGEQWRLSEENYTRYEPYISALEQVGVKPLMAFYRHYAPLFEQAYQELGVDKGSFEQVAKGALKRIIDVPMTNGPVALASTTVFYHYQDKTTEKLPGLNKLFIRMGPKNQSRVQVFAQQLLEQMGQ
jgi:Protein of unknown function (DUF3014)